MILLVSYLLRFSGRRGEVWMIPAGRPPYLVVVVLAVEKRLLQEDHAGQHAAEAPHVQTVVIHLQKHPQRQIS